MKSNKILLSILAFLVIGGGLYFFSQTNLQNFSAGKSSPTVKFSKLIGTEDFEIFPLFYVTISPDNKYLLYFSKSGKVNSFGYDEDDYNLNAIDLKSNKKFIIDKQDIFGGQLAIAFSRECWSTDSRFCVLPVGHPIKELPSGSEWQTKENFIEMYKSQPSIKVTWLDGTLLAKDVLNEKDQSVGLLNNAPDIIIDFTGQKPSLIKQYFNVSKYDISKKSSVRKTFDSLTNGIFTCSDCGTNIILEKKIDSNHHSDEYYSPNNLYVASLVTKEISGTFVSSPKLYIERLSDHKKIFVGENVYKLIWTSDSNSIYVYKCESGGACGSSSADAIYKVDLSIVF